VVYKGKCRGNDVAIKCVVSSRFPSQIALLFRPLEVLSHLYPFRHIICLWCPPPLRRQAITKGERMKSIEFKALQKEFQA
jgi:hypothetical protein